MSDQRDDERGPVFVLHEHRVPRLHWDLRLEEDGVLRSWALPKGLPTDSRHDRLAVAVPDHELEHATSEDAGKDIADTGWWQLEDRTDRRLLLVLHGRGEPRRYALIDTGRDWLLHLVKEQPAPTGADRPGGPGETGQATGTTSSSSSLSEPSSGP